MDPLTLGAIGVLLFVVFFLKPKGAKPAVQGAPASGNRHAGHAFVDAFEALEKEGIADRVKSDVGAKGADAFAGKLATYLGSSPAPNEPPAKA